MADIDSRAASKLAELLDQIARLANTADELLNDAESYHADAAKCIVTQIGAIAEAGRALVGDEMPLLRGDMAAWLAPYLTSKGESDHA